MGGAVSSLANGITKVRDTVNNATGTRLGDFATYGANSVVGAAGGAGITGAAGDVANSKGPESPGIDPALQALKDQQLKNARDFRSNLGTTRSRLQQDLTGANNTKMNTDLHTTDENSNARGLLYGGMNAGARAGVRANAKTNLASGISTINTGLNDAADTLDQQAISTGQAIQKSQQDIQNQIYSQALAQQNANNSMAGSAASTGLLLALL